MSADQDWSRRQSRNFQTLALPPQDIPDKRSFFNPAMNPRLLECFNRGRLSVGEPRFCAPLGNIQRPLPRVLTSRNSIAPLRTR
jgi:hypothetical protein